MGRSTRYSDEELDFIKANQKLLRKDLHILFIKKFNRTEVTVNALNSLCKRNRWLSGRKAKGGSHYDQAVIEFLSENRDMPREQLKNEINCKFGLSMTYNAVVNLCTRKGFHSKNTGQFGEHDGWRQGIAYQNRPIGYEASPDKRGRVYVKTGMPSEYRLKHHLIYEQHFGEIPENHVIVFKDSNCLNFNPNNLIAVHRGAIGTLNRRYKSHSAPDEVKPLLLTMAQIDHKIYQKEREDA